ncbi:MAG: hybrid sensor histidine kinase/response regulator [Azonexus sp.]
MSHGFMTTATDEAIAAEQIKAYFKETSAQNLVGTVVISLIVLATAEFTPLWTWAPALLLVYGVTVVRAYLIWGHYRAPDKPPAATWGRQQTVCAGLNGMAWGFINMASCAHLPMTYQLFIASVAAVSAAASASEGFAYFQPSRAFICTSLFPLTLWFLSQSERLPLILGAMLCIFVPILLWQGSKRHHAFIESLKLRFKNEFLARELTIQQKIAEDAGQAKSRFLAAASHDLRQPVQALAIFQDLLRPEMQLTPLGETYFLKTQQAIKAVSSLLGTLLDISRLESNTVKAQRELIRVAPLIEQMQREFGALAEQKGIKLHTVGCSASLETDAMLLGQILRNLVANALRYTHSGKILVGCRRRGRLLAIEVWDTGIGIRKEHQASIFSEFFQIGNQERDRQHGLGLGLAIVERAARLIGAKISLRSQFGKGSCFAVSLPISRRRAPFNPDVTQPFSSPFDLGGRLIVLVENEEDIRKGFHTMLEKWGCRVISGHSWRSIESQLPTQKIDAVISDFGLAKHENGITVIGKLRVRFGRQLPALLITGDTSQQTLQAASEAGLPILHKPIKPWQLRQTLCSLLKPPAGL